MPRHFAIAVALFYVPLALLALVVIGWRTGDEGIASRLVGERPLLELALGVAAGLTSAYLLRGLGRFWTAGRELEDGLVRILGPLRPASCAVLALSSGIAEELAFRAALQPEVGLVVASLLFGLVHAPLKRELMAWPLLAAAMGFLLGWLYDWTGGVLAPVAAHVAVNWVNLLYLARRAREIPPPRLPSEFEAREPEGSEPE